MLGTLLPALAGLERRSLSKFAASILAAGSVLVEVKKFKGVLHEVFGSQPQTAQHIQFTRKFDGVLEVGTS